MSALTKLSVTVSSAAARPAATRGQAAQRPASATSDRATAAARARRSAKRPRPASARRQRSANLRAVSTVDRGARASGAGARETARIGTRHRRFSRPTRRFGDNSMHVRGRSTGAAGGRGESERRLRPHPTAHATCHGSPHEPIAARRIHRPRATAPESRVRVRRRSPRSRRRPAPRRRSCARRRPRRRSPPRSCRTPARRRPGADGRGATIADDAGKTVAITAGRRRRPRRRPSASRGTPPAAEAERRRADDRRAAAVAHRRSAQAASPSTASAATASTTRSTQFVETSRGSPRWCS